MDRLFLSVLTLLLVLVMGAINIMINVNYIINQGAVLVIMSAILSTLTSVSLHYDHSLLALPMEVGHHPHLGSLVVKVLLFKVITKVKF